MADCGRDDDRILRWVLKKEYGIRSPSAEQLRNYAHWQAVSRRDGFDGLEPEGWQEWPWKPIPDGVVPLVITYPAPAPEPVIESDPSERVVPEPEPAPPEPAHGDGGERR